MKLFKNVCNLIGLLIVASGFVSLIAWCGYDIVVKTYRNFAGLSESIVIVLLFCLALRVICKVFGVNFSELTKVNVHESGAVAALSYCF